MSSPDHPLSHPANACSPAGFRRGRERKQKRDGTTGPVATPRLSAPQWHPDQPWTQLPIAGAESNSGTSQAIHSHSDSSSPWATGTNTPASGWFCFPSSSGGHPESPFCRPSNDPSPSSNGDGRRATIDTQEGRRGGHVSSGGMSQQLLGGCTQGAPGSLAVALACPIPGEFPAAASLGHPTGECHSSRDLHSRVSATCLSGGPTAFVIDTPRPLTEAADFRRRATAYRNSYFKSYRRNSWRTSCSPSGTTFRIRSDPHRPSTGTYNG